MYYVYDLEGIEPPIGPFTKAEAEKIQNQLGEGWGILPQETAEQIYTYLAEEED